MRFAQVSFVSRRVLKSLRELPWTHVLTAGPMTMTLFIYVGFLLIQEYLHGLLHGWKSQVQVFAYLDNGAGAVDAMVKQVRSYPEVERVGYVSKAEAWEKFRRSLGAQSGVLEGLNADILPASLEITLAPSHRSRAAVEGLARRLRAVAGISEVEYPEEWVEKLGLLVLGIRWTKWVLGGFLFVATLLIVGSTVRLAFLARRDEIEIMQLVGASAGLIKAPFVIEGMIQGIVGASLALFGLWLVFLLLRERVPSSLAVFVPGGAVRFLDLRGAGVLLVLGLAMGTGGSLFALRKFLKRWGR
ncbi:MAG: ABC transporter permease [Deltaproteobacteria bacterium]|nr:ABC transporter permease [Deltaproteobacteria bacterium]